MIDVHEPDEEEGSTDLTINLLIINQLPNDETTTIEEPDHEHGHGVYSYDMVPLACVILLAIACLVSVIYTCEILRHGL